ncbi:MAG: glycosyltransferase family 39 protein [Verrucomicrobiia bacterium]
MSHRTKMCIAVFGVAVMVRLICLAYWMPRLNPDVDMDSYRSLARSVVAGNGFVATGPDGREMPDVGRTPLYPLFLAGLMKLSGDRLGVFLTVQCVLWGMISWLTILLAARWLSWNRAMAAGLLVALDPNAVMRGLDLRTETLFTLVVLGGTCALAWRNERSWGWFWTGLLWSLASLCRPIAVWLWAVALILTIIWHRRVACFAMFLIGFLPLLGLWMARNAAVTGQWFFSTNAADNLLESWAAGVDADRRGVDVVTTRDELRHGVGTVEFFDDRDSFSNRLQNSLHTSRRILLSAPLITLKEAALGWGKLLLGPGQRTLEPSLLKPEPPSRWWPPLYSVALLVVLVLSTVGVWKLGHSALLPGILLLYFVALAGGPVSYSRYRVPITPLLAVLAVAGACGSEKKT